MRKNLNYIICLLLLAAAVSCKKPTALSGTNSDVAYISLTNVNASGKAIDVYIDGAKANLYSSISANANVLGTYVGTTPGTHTLEVRDATTGAVYGSTSINVTGGQTYSAFVYDVSTTGALKMLVLNTDRTASLPDSVHTNIRFLNLAPNSPALDVWLIRRLGGVNTDSSIIYANVPYLGNTTPDVNSLSAFKTISAGVAAGAPGYSTTQDYLIRLKLAGTNTIVPTNVSSTNPTGIFSVTFLPTKIYTIYVRGVYPSLTITTLLQN